MNDSCQKLIPPMSAVVAMALNRVIGDRGRLPWHIPEDLKWFRQLTTGHVVLMGRKTFESIGKPLAGRTNVVLTRTGATWQGVLSVSSLDQLPDAAAGQKIFVCGGTRVFELTMPYWVEVYLTLVRRTVPGDTRMPLFEDRFEPDRVLVDHPEFRIIHYVRRA